MNDDNNRAITIDNHHGWIGVVDNVHVVFLPRNYPGRVHQWIWRQGRICDASRPDMAWTYHPPSRSILLSTFSIANQWKCTAEGYILSADSNLAIGFQSGIAYWKPIVGCLISDTCQHVQCQWLDPKLTKICPSIVTSPIVNFYSTPLSEHRSWMKQRDETFPSLVSNCTIDVWSCVKSSTPRTLLCHDAQVHEIQHIRDQVWSISVQSNNDESGIDQLLIWSDKGWSWNGQLAHVVWYPPDKTDVSLPIAKINRYGESFSNSKMMSPSVMHLRSYCSPWYRVLSKTNDRCLTCVGTFQNSRSEPGNPKDYQNSRSEPGNPKDYQNLRSESDSPKDYQNLRSESENKDDMQCNATCLWDRPSAINNHSQIWMPIPSQPGYVQLMHWSNSTGEIASVAARTKFTNDQAWMPCLHYFPTQYPGVLSDNAEFQGIYFPMRTFVTLFSAGYRYWMLPDEKQGMRLIQSSEDDLQLLTDETKWEMVPWTTAGDSRFALRSSIQSKHMLLAWNRSKRNWEWTDNESLATWWMIDTVATQDRSLSMHDPGMCICMTHDRQLAITIEHNSANQPIAICTTVKQGWKQLSSMRQHMWFIIRESVAPSIKSNIMTIADQSNTWLNDHSYVSIIAVVALCASTLSILSSSWNKKDQSDRKYFM